MASRGSMQARDTPHPTTTTSICGWQLLRRSAPHFFTIYKQELSFTLYEPSPRPAVYRPHLPFTFKPNSLSYLLAIGDS